jgi:hypothetical protein
MSVDIGYLSKLDNQIVACLNLEGSGFVDSIGKRYFLKHTRIVLNRVKSDLIKILDT